MAAGTAGVINLGSAYAELLIDTSKLEQQLNSAFNTVEQTAESAFRRITSTIESSGAKLEVWGAKMQNVTRPITALRDQAIQVYADIDDALAEVQARTGATAAEMELVRTKALEMGEATIFSARDAAQAMLELQVSGYTLNETMATLGPTLALAAAGNLSMKESADGLTDVLKTFGLGVDSAEKVIQVLNAGAATSSATVRELILGLQNVGPVAETFGMSVEETVAVLAAFAERGIKSAKAGTQLRSMLSRMTRPAETVQKAWNDLGISMFDAAGNVRPLRETMLDLSAALAGMTEEKKIETLKVLGSHYGQLGLSILTSSDAMGLQLSQMNDAGDVYDVAAIRTQTLSGRFEYLRSSIETLLVVAATPLIEGFLKPAITYIGGIINRISDWVQKNEGLTNGLVAFLSVLTVLGPIAINFGRTLRLISFLMGLTNPLIFLAAMAVGALFVAFHQNWGGIGDTLRDVGDTIAYIFGWLQKAYDAGIAQGGSPLDGLVKAFSALFYVFRDGETTFISKFLQSLGFAEDVAKRVGLIIAGLGNRMAMIFGAFSHYAEVIGPLLDNALKAFTEGDLEGALDSLKLAWEFFVLFVKTWVWPELKKVLNWLWEQFKIAMEWLFSVENMRTLGEAIESFLWWATDLLWEGIKIITPWLWQALKDAVQWLWDNKEEIWERLDAFLTPIVDWALDVGDAIGVAIVEWTEQAVDDLLIWLGQLLIRFGAWIVYDLVPSVREWMIGARDAFVDWAESAWSWLRTKLGKFWKDFKSWISDIFTADVAGAAADVTDSFTGWASGAWDNLKEKLQTFIDDFKSWINDKFGTTDPESVPNSMVDAGEQVIQGLWDGLKQKFEELKTWFADEIEDSLVGQALTKLGILSPSYIFHDIGTNVIQGLINGLRSMFFGLGLAMTAMLVIMTGMRWILMKSGTGLGEAFMQGIINGIYNKTSTLFSLIGQVISSIQSRLQSAFQIFSPSKYTTWIGEQLILGLSEGLGMLDPIAKATDNLTDSMRLGLAGSAAGGMVSGMQTNQTRQTNKTAITVNVTVDKDTMRQEPNARNYANTLGDELGNALKRHGVGITTLNG